MKILVVGAGPAGATAALLLARQRRHEVVLVDESAFPRVKTCASGLGPRCVKLIRNLDISTEVERIAHPIRGAYFAGPSGRVCRIHGKKAGILIARRSEFDGLVARLAESAGARFEQQFKARQVLRDPNGRIRGVKNGNREIEADLTLFADGTHSRFSPDRRPKQRIATIMGWWQGVQHDPDHIEVWFSPRVLPWYGWLFPERDGRVNIGIGYSPDDSAHPKEILEEIIARHLNTRMRGAEQVSCDDCSTPKLRGAPITYADDVGPIAAPGALWLGEAARLASAATGEGIFQAMDCARLANDVIARAGEAQIPTEYERTVRAIFDPRMKAARRFVSFAGTPLFSWVTRLATVKSVQKGVVRALSSV